MNTNWKGYYKSGQLKYSGEYDNDYKVNTWTYWSDKGKIIETKNYKVVTIKAFLFPMKIDSLKSLFQMENG